MNLKPFIQGMLSAFTLFPKPRSVEELTSELPHVQRKKSDDPDVDALRSDWEEVGNDMRTAIRRIENGY